MDKDLRFGAGVVSVIILGCVGFFILLTSSPNATSHMDTNLLGIFMSVALGVFALSKKTVFKCLIDSMIVVSFLTMLMAPWHYIQSENLTEAAVIGSTGLVCIIIAPLVAAFIDNTRQD